LRKIYWIILLCFIARFVHAQNSVKGNREVYFGNKAYEKGDWKTAVSEYQKGLNINPKNDAARINLALAQTKLSEAEKAIQNFDEAINNNKNNPALNAALNYNKGVAMAKAKKYQEAINAFENSLRINPDNQQARENLQKAINELKQQQQNQQNKQNQNKQQQKQNNKQQQQQNKQQQRQNQNQMSKEQAEQMLQSLREQEKEIQRKLNQQKTGGEIPQSDKDW